MKILAFNGSPRKNFNTATLLNKTLEGASSKGAQTEMIHLYDLNFKGCVSCFACKLKGGKSYGRCAVKDDLAPVLEKIETADALVFGSPVYLGSASGIMQSFLERLVFQYIEYSPGYPVLFKRKIPTAFIFTMNVNAEMMKTMGYEPTFKRYESYIGRIFGSCQALTVNDTYQFTDYSKYVSSLFDPESKVRIKSEVFPIDCQKAFEIGVNFVEENKIAI